MPPANIFICLSDLVLSKFFGTVNINSLSVKILSTTNQNSFNFLIHTYVRLDFSRLD